MQKRNPSFTNCPNNIFWNTYAQELGFLEIYREVSPHAAKTGAKLAAIYPDIDEAEQFMRAQFCTKIERGYTLPDIVMNFSHFIGDAHHKAFHRWRHNQPLIVRDDVGFANANVAEYRRRAAKPYRVSNPLPMTPLGRYLLLGEDADAADKEAVVRLVLHYPLYLDHFDLTDAMQEQQAFYHREVRQPVAVKY